MKTELSLYEASIEFNVSLHMLTHAAARGYLRTRIASPPGQGHTVRPPLHFVTRTEIEEFLDRKEKFTQPVQNFLPTKARPSRVNEDDVKLRAIIRKIEDIQEAKRLKHLTNWL